MLMKAKNQNQFPLFPIFNASIDPSTDSIIRNYIYHRVLSCFQIAVVHKTPIKVGASWMREAQVTTIFASAADITNLIAGKFTAVSPRDFTIISILPVELGIDITFGHVSTHRSLDNAWLPSPTRPI